jgi:hypothetical protein
MNLGLLYQEKYGRLMQSGKSREARDAIVAVTRYMPSANAQVNLGIADYSLGDKPAALAAFRKGLQMDPNVKERFFPAGNGTAPAGPGANRLRPILEDKEFLRQLFAEN